MWWEAFPANATQRLSIAVNPGDYMFVSVEHTGYGTAITTVMDETSNNGYICDLSWTGYTVGTDADWMLERYNQDGGSAYGYLAKVNYQTPPAHTAFYSMYANGTPIGQLDRYYYYMQRCDNHDIIAHNGSLNTAGTLAQIIWDQYGDAC